MGKYLVKPRVRMETVEPYTTLAGNADVIIKSKIPWIVQNSGKQVMGIVNSGSSICVLCAKFAHAFG